MARFGAECPVAGPVLSEVEGIYPACLEVAHIVGIFNYLTRLADGLGLQLDAGTRQAAETGVALKRPE